MSSLLSSLPHCLTPEHAAWSLHHNRDKRRSLSPGGDGLTASSYTLRTAAVERARHDSRVVLARAPDTPTQPRRRTTAAMPELPDDLISLSSLDGANLAAAQPAAAPMWSLLAHFETQHTQSFCSIATAAMLLNVLGVPRPIDPAYAPYPYFTQANVLGECALARPVTPNKNRAGGENISVATQPHPKSQTATPTPTLARIHAADALTRRSHSSAHMARRWPSGAITSPAGRTRPSATPQRRSS